MNERNETEIKDTNTTTHNDEETSAQKTPESEIGEFKITVRKLDMPVRPRGVLAE